MTATASSAAQRRGGPARGRVQKIRNNSSARRNDTTLKVLREPSTWARMDWLRQNSARHGQRMCGLSSAADEVTVQRNPKGAVSYGGLLTCDSRTCPSCGPRIAAATRNELELAINNWAPSSSSSRKLWFGTFTIRHKKGQPFKELADAVSSCWAAATGGRGWVNDRMQHGIEHTVRIFEQKWGQNNGWHIHVHVLFFIDERFSAASSHELLLETMFKRWARAAADLGMGVPLIRAQDLHEVDSAAALDRVAGYFAKETTDASDAHPGSIAAEMSNAAGKQGLSSLTPGQLLSWAMEGEKYISQLWGGASPRARGRGAQGQEYARYLYREFELGMKGRRTIAWSRGMREALGLGAELTDEQLAKQQELAEAATRETLVSMTGSDWRRFTARHGRRAELYTMAQTLDRFELVEWLAGYGVQATPHRRDRTNEPAGPWFEYTDATPF